MSSTRSMENDIEGHTGWHPGHKMLVDIVVMKKINTKI